MEDFLSAVSVSKNAESLEKEVDEPSINKDVDETSSQHSRTSAKSRVSHTSLISKLSRTSHGSARSHTSDESTGSKRSKQSRGSIRSLRSIMSKSSKRSQKQSECSADSDMFRVFKNDMDDETPPAHKHTHTHTHTPVVDNLSNEEIMTMKLDILFKVQILHQAGYVSPRKYTKEDSLVSLEMELQRLQTLEDMSYGLQMCRWGLTNGVSMIESVNESFQVTPFRLRGWSTTVHRQSHKFDPILMELYQSYAYRVRLGPMTKLCIALSFSAVNTHMANTMRGLDEKGSDNAFSNIMGMMMGNVGSMFGSKPTKPSSTQAPSQPFPQPNMRGPTFSSNDKQ
jgi:hypothetical protein